MGREDAAVPAGLVREAWQVAGATAARAGARVTELHGMAQVRAAAGLVKAVWRFPGDGSPFPPELLRAFAHAGAYVAGAWHGERLVGAAAGFFHPDGRGGFALHSHVLGVLEAAQGRGVGLALKQHQRAWALERGVREIGWTFDPLVRRNAWFNLARLGAEPVQYLPDFYGQMADPLNAGDASDRCLVRWRLDGARAVAAAQGRLAMPDLDELRAAGAGELLAEGPDGWPVTRPRQGLGPLLCWVPPDIVALRATDLACARAWRQALRDTLGAALAAGLPAAAMTASGCYVLGSPGATPP